MNNIIEIYSQDDFDEFVSYTKTQKEGESLTVILFGGLFELKEPIHLKSHTTIIGNSSSIEFKLEKEQTLPYGVFNLVGESSNYIKNIYISDLIVIQKSKDKKGIHGIYVKYGENVNIHNNKLIGNGDSSGSECQGISILNSKYSSIISNIFTDFLGSALYIGDVINSMILSNSLEGSKGGGIEITNSEGNLIKENAFENNRESSRGIELKSSKFSCLSGNSVDGVRERMGLNVEGSNGNVLSGNLISNNATYGAYMINSSQNSLVSNYFSFNGSDGINITSTSRNNILIANTTLNNGRDYTNSGSSNTLGVSYNSFLGAGNEVNNPF